MNIVRCPPVTMVLIRRPDLRYQLGFSVQNGIVSNETGLGFDGKKKLFTEPGVLSMREKKQKKSVSFGVKAK